MSRSPRLGACAAALSALLSGCVCAVLEPGAKYVCDSGSDCLHGEQCLSGVCGGAGGGSGGSGGDGGCIAFDEPDTLFRDTNCDGVDGIADGGLFVDPAGGNDANPGTRERPLLTLERALVVAGTATHSIFLSTNATYQPVGTVEWTKHVSIYGGYHADAGWVRDGEHAVVRGKQLAIRATRDAGLALVGVDVFAEPATGLGQPSIALLVSGTTLLLEQVELSAGEGATGANGAAGAQGESGTNGGDGGWGALCFDAGCAQALAGTAGSSPCIGQGFGGGRGSITDGSGDRGQPTALGGPGGNGASIGCASCPCPGLNTAGPGGTAAVTPFFADAGALGDAGSDQGFVDGGLWFAAYGVTGTDGAPGQHGFGGGGGGALVFPGGWLGGSSGGGGGGAGCGGHGGLGGQGGGASIALLINAGRVVANDLLLKTAQGGTGGRGGTGGGGGVPGFGGKGGPAMIAYCSGTEFTLSPSGALANMVSGAGGDGSDGTFGGIGGPGGGGSGGPSIGAYCANGGALSQLPRFMVGSGGPGGAPNGKRGLSVLTFACTN